MRGYRDLVVWQKAMELVTEVYRITADFPKHELYGLTGQIRRAAVSVPSNLAEGHGRTSSREFHQFISQARGSLVEVETQLEIARNLGYLSPPLASELLAKAGRVGRMLNGLRAWSESREGSKPTPDSRLPKAQNMPRTMLLAIGGNSLIRAGEKGTVVEQLANARRTAAAVIGLIRDGYRLVITHGNGPQVGADLLRSERAADQVPGLPLDVCGAATQGEIGYLLCQSLHYELDAAGLQVPLVSIITQTVVSRDDPAMQHPSKPIGPFYLRADAEQRKRAFGWEIVEDAARGYRRVVPSPEPIDIVELEVIRDLVQDGVLVVAVGGGGIPVMRSNGRLQG